MYAIHGKLTCYLSIFTVMLVVYGIITVTFLFRSAVELFVVRPDLMGTF